MFSSISLPQKTGVCLLYCFMLSPVISLGAVPHHHLALSVKEFEFENISVTLSGFRKLSTRERNPGKERACAGIWRLNGEILEQQG